MKYHPRTKPFKHQAQATLRAARARNYAFFFEPRCGKSKAGLDVVGIHATADRVKKCLILCPAIAMDVWAKQIKLHYPGSCNVETFTHEWFHERDHFAAVDFFIASREEVFRRTPGKGKKKYSREKQKVLEAWEPDLVIVDESHEYKRAGGVAAQDGWRMIRRLRVRYLKRHPRDKLPKPWVLLMSGTPSPKGWIDLFAQFRIMDERIFGTSKAEFEEEHCVYGKGRKKWTIIKYRREKVIERKVRAYSSTVTAEQAGLAGKVFYQRLNVKLSEKATRLYLKIATDFLAEWEGGVISAKNAGVKRIRLLQVTGGFTTEGGQLHDAKLRALAAYGSVLVEQSESLVVYARFTAEVEAIEGVLQRVGFRAFRVDGGTPSRLRRAAIDSLADIPREPTAVVFQHQAGSRAIELVGAAEVVYYSAPDGWVEYRQTSARVTGPNQKRPVRYTFLTVPGTVDVGVLRGLKRKEEWHDSLMRDPRGYLLGLIQ